jgi:large subunit ribosomal protein L6
VKFGKNKNMSKIGKKPILIPEGTEIKIDGQKVFIKGPKGQLFREIPSEIKIQVRNNKIFILPEVESIFNKKFWGTTRSILANMVNGVSKGFEKKLEIQGIGFKAAIEGDEIILNVGYSHPVKIKIPQNLKILIEKNIISVSGIDKEMVGQFAAVIRKIKTPEPYKGKGIRYLGEQVRKKAGKKAEKTK